jgi:hypothetical protein
VWDAVFHPDEQILATASEDSTVRLWHILSGDLLATFHSEHRALPDFFGYGQLAFNRAGDIFATASSDGVARYRSLLPPSTAPVLTTPSDGTTLDAMTARGLVLEWESPDTTECDVQIALDDSFADSVFEARSVPPGSVSVPLSTLDTGAYHWRVRSVLFDPGPWSTPLSFDVQAETVVRLSSTDIPLPDVTLELLVEGIQGLFGFQATVAYDPEVLEVTEVVEGAFLGQDGATTFWQPPVVDEVLGRVTIFGSRLDPETVSGDGVLAIIQARALHTGKTTVALSELKVSNAESESISALPVGVVINVGSEASLRVETTPTIVDNEVAVQIQVTDASDVMSYALNVPTPPQLELVEGSNAITGVGTPTSGVLETLRFRIWETGALTIGATGTLKAGNGLAALISVNAGQITVYASPAADINKDYRVDIVDLVSIAQNFDARPPTNARPNPDISRDGVVDIFDVVAVAARFGQRYDASTGDILAAPGRIHSLDMDWSIADHYGPEWRHMLSELPSQPDTRGRYTRTRELLLHLLNVSGVGQPPMRTALLPNYPNPFNPETWIPFELSEDADVVVTIYDLEGALIRTLRLGEKTVGRYHGRDRAAYWDGANEQGEAVASGVYVYELRAGDYREMRRMVIRK